MEHTRLFQNEPLERFQEIVATHIDAINLAVANIPPERIRLHVCWGNNDSPHIYDVPLRGHPADPLSGQGRRPILELANPRHQHEYKVFKRHPLPDAMLFVPG